MTWLTTWNYRIPICCLQSIIHLTIGKPGEFWVIFVTSSHHLAWEQRNWDCVRKSIFLVIYPTIIDSALHLTSPSSFSCCPATNFSPSYSLPWLRISDVTMTQDENIPGDALLITDYIYFCSSVGPDQICCICIDQ